MRKLVLASTSAYRQRLLETLNRDFVCHGPNVDEQALPGETPANLVARLAVNKAQAVAPTYPDALVIGSDQIALLDGAIITKPLTHERARAQLKAASHRQVQFLTGLCLYNTLTHGSQVDVIATSVTFRSLNDDQIEYYLQSEKPYDCAGSFKAEGLGIALFESIHGDDPNALIGLPLIRLVAMLAHEGVDVLLPE